MEISEPRPAVALAGALALAVWSLAAPASGAAATPVPHADKGHHRGQARPASTPAAPATAAPTKATRATTTRATAPRTTRRSAGSAASHVRADRAAPRAGTGGAAAGHKDGVGNNGTVKIDRLGVIDRIPNNVPHPGCTFRVAWFGFDGGSEVGSTVTFSMQAPTRDVALGVAGPAVVPVGGDPASGAGTASGPDAVQTYTLDFAGPAHPRQGYHVRLTVATPRSLGNDTKTKMFWVRPCTSARASFAAAPALPGRPAGSTAPAQTTTTVSLGIQRPPTGLTETSASRPPASTETSTDVPFLVEAGSAARSALNHVAEAPCASGLGVLGVLMVGAGVALRLRRRA